MSTKAKYEKSKQINSMRSFENTKAVWFKITNRNIAHGGKTVHRAFLESMPYRTLYKFIKDGALYTAKMKKEK